MDFKKIKIIAYLLFAWMTNLGTAAAFPYFAKGNNAPFEIADKKWRDIIFH